MSLSPLWCWSLSRWNRSPVPRVHSHLDPTNHSRAQSMTQRCQQPGIRAPECRNTGSTSRPIRFQSSRKELHRRYAAAANPLRCQPSTCTKRAACAIPQVSDLVPPSDSPARGSRRGSWHPPQKRTIHLYRERSHDRRWTKQSDQSL